MKPLRQTHGKETTPPVENISSGRTETWSWIEGHRSQILSWCRSVARGREDVAESLWSEAVDRLPAIIANWSPSRGVSLAAYAYRCLRWWWHKRLAADAWRLLRNTPIDQRSCTCRDSHTEDIECRHAVFLIMGRLSTADAGLLWMRLVDGFSFREISRRTGLCKDTVSKRYGDAFARAMDARDAVMGDD